MMFDILAFLCTCLHESTGLHVSTEVPADRPQKFITVYRDGGPRRQHVDNPTITIQTWAATDAEAYELALQVRDVMEGLIYYAKISDVVVQSLRVNNHKDGHHRYEAVYQLICPR